MAAKPPAATRQRGPSVGSPGDLVAAANAPIGAMSDEQVLGIDNELLGDAPVGAAGGEDDLSPIGVPQGYTATGTKTKTGGGWGKYKYNVETPIPPRYFAGDELGPSSYSPAVVADLQVALVEAGLLRKNGFKLGAWDDASIAAYGDLLAFANRQGLDWKAALSKYKQGVAAEGKYAGFGVGADGDADRKLVIRQTNPADIKALLDDVSGRVIGRSLNDAEKDQFVATFQATERQRQEQAFALEESGGTITDEPDPRVAAEAFVKSSRPQETHEYDFRTRYNQFLELI